MIKKLGCVRLILLLFVFVIYTNPNLVAQQKKEVVTKQTVILKINGSVTLNGTKLKEAIVTLFQGSSKQNTIFTDKDGKFTFELDLQKEYTIEVSKKNLVAQKIKINTNVPEKNMKGDNWWACKVKLNLFEYVDGIGTLDEPVKLIKFFDKDDDFKIDEAYTAPMDKKVEEMAAQVVNLKSQAFDKEMKKADQLFAKKQYEEAWLSYAKAKELSPMDKSASDGIQKVKQKIKLSPEKGYEQATEKAMKAFADKKFAEAKKYFEIALLYKENDAAAIAKSEEMAGILNGTIKPDNFADEVKPLDKKTEKDIVEKIESFKKNLKVYEKNNDKRSISSILDSIGNLYRIKNENLEAVQYFEDAVKVKEEIGDKDGVSKVLSKEAKIFLELGQYDNTLKCYEKALKINEELNNKTEMANILNNMASLYSYTYRSDDAITAYEKLLDIKKQMGDEKGISEVHSNMGDIYLNKDDANMAIDHYSKSLKMDIDSKDKKGQASLYNSIGVAHYKKGNFNDANENLKKALDLFTELNDRGGKSKALNNLGNVAYKQKDFAKAIDYYENAGKLTRELGDQKGLVSALYNMGNIFKEQKQYPKALQKFNESVDIAKQISYQDALGKNYNAISKIYYEEKDFQKAYDFYKLYVDARFDADDEDQLSEIQSKVASDLEIAKLRNKLSKQELLAKMKEEKSKKELQLRDMEIQKKDEEVKKQRILIFSFIIGFLLIAVFSIMLFRQYKQIKKANQLLAMQNEEIKQQKEEIETQRDQLAEANIELEKLSIVARETDNAVIIMDGSGTFEWVNEGFSKIWGMNLQQLKESKGSDLITTSSNPDIKELYETCVEDKITVSYDSVATNAKGEKIWTQTTLTPIFDAFGKCVKLVAIDSNITLIKLAEEEIKQQNEEIKAQSELLRETNNILHTKNIQIMDSINYAQRIQEAILPRLSLIRTYLPDSFVLFKPKDVVSGDFYWFTQMGNKTYIAAVDCTGHGVPGAFMSMIGNTLLNEIVVNKKITKPSEILLELNKGVSFALTQGKEGDDTQDDGMDISMCCIDLDSNEAILALGGHTATVIRDGKMEAVEGDIFSIGGMFANNPNVSFTDNVIKLDQDTYIYMNSDGYQDQFGGPEGRKFMASRLTKMLVEHHAEPMTEQGDKFEQIFMDWKGQKKQLDDVLLIGLKLTKRI